MDELKTWIIEVIVKKTGPSAIRGAILGIIGWLCVKNGMIPGVTSNAITHTTLIDWNVLSDWAIAGLPAALAMGIKLFQHHTQATIAGTSQTGEISK